jgi:hypothetical protein
VKISVVIPTYWTSFNQIVQRQTPDAIYDHPTPLEAQSTLPRLFDSLKETDMPRKSATIIVIAAVTHRALEEKAEEKTREIIGNYKDWFNIQLVSASKLREIESKETSLAQVLNLYGYSNIRNIGLAVAQILKSDILIFLDDDVIVNDQTYFQKAQEYLKKPIDRTRLGGIAGYYTNKDGSYFSSINPREWWKAFWPKERKMNEAFKVIATNKRLTETGFAFGGNMVVHWKMFQEIPFDPYITRGEDMDLLVNAKMFDFKIMLDTKLSVLHLPGEKKNQWSEMRQDLYRFRYMREKLQNQRNIKNTQNVTIESLAPYIGYFLRSRTPFKFAASTCLNGLHSLVQGNMEDWKEFTRNIFEIPFSIRFAKRCREEYFKFQKQWQTHIPKIRGNPSLADSLTSSQ